MINSKLLDVLSTCITNKIYFNFEIANKYYFIKNISVQHVDGTIKLKGIINDFKLLPMLSKTMLGPNSKFIDIKIFPFYNNFIYKIIIVANLVNIIQKMDHIELNFIIKSIKNINSNN